MINFTHAGKKICLINPPTTDPRETNIYFPMALITLGGVLRECGYQAELWDFDLYFKKAGNSTEQGLRKLLQLGIRAVRTDIFAISSICSNFPMALWLAREIKAYRPESLVILGGPQPSSVPQQILERFEFVDIVAVGEGEHTLEEMCRVDFDRARLEAIPGLAFRSPEGIRVNPKRELSKQMDEFPFPDYSLLNLKDYRELDPYFLPHVEVGRGCPFHCTFCSTSLMWEKSYRVKTPGRILREMENLFQAYGFTEFDFIHDNFTTSRKFVLDFCGHMEKHNQHSLKWACSSRTDCIDINRLELMHSVGLFALFFGIETGSERMQATIKKNLDFEHFEPILKRANELGVNSTTAFILGFPEEEEEDLHQSLHRGLHYKALGTPRVFFSKLSALTGTKIYRDYVDRLEETNLASSISPQHYGLKYVQDLIHQHPDLFSSYYHIPHPKFSRDYLSKFVEFADKLVNGRPEIALAVIENMKIPATKLFEIWDHWAATKKIPYQDYRVFTHQEFQILFTQFLDETIFRKTSTAPIPALAQAG